MQRDTSTRQAKRGVYSLAFFSANVVVQLPAPKPRRLAFGSAFRGPAVSVSAAGVTMILTVCVSQRLFPEGLDVACSRSQLTTTCISG